MSSSAIETTGTYRSATRRESVSRGELRRRRRDRYVVAVAAAVILAALLVVAAVAVAHRQGRRSDPGSLRSLPAQARSAAVSSRAA